MRTPPPTAAHAESMYTIFDEDTGHSVSTGHPTPEAALAALEDHLADIRRTTDATGEGWQNMDLAWAVIDDTAGGAVAWHRGAPFPL